MRERTACPPGCQKTPREPGVRALLWTLGILAVPIGALTFWKWRQITTSGVPIDFALRRTFSRNFPEGHVAMREAWDRTRGVAAQAVSA